MPAILAAMPTFHLFLPQMRMTMPDLVDRARAAEAAGFEGIAFMDHLAPPMAESQPMFEAITTAAWVAAHTERLTVGHLVLCDAFRYPAMLAKEIATLDHASGGRVELGIGSGSIPEELDLYGIGAGTTGARIDRLAETLDLLDSWWAGTADAPLAPPPTRKVPIVIGGTGPRMLGLVARHADWWNVPMHQLGRLEEMRPRAGDARVSVQQMITFVDDESRRDEITTTADRRFGPTGRVCGNAEEILEIAAGWDARGVERVYAWFTDFAAPDTLRAFGEQVIARAG
jgi:alkanesulfonate monooxygenase SsuD/methylene tetrahydromethanopterin reductase-like flavin-dependent oxidoreductase (luciferase family)